MEGMAGLRGSETRQEAGIDVVVDAGHVRPGMVEHVVFASPDVRAAAEQVEGEGHDAVPPTVSRIGAV
jgi:hypothetical protein